MHKQNYDTQSLGGCINFILCIYKSIKSWVYNVCDNVRNIIMVVEKDRSPCQLSVIRQPADASGWQSV